MANTYFQFRQFTIHQESSAMKVTTDACLFGAWVAEQLCKKKGTCLDIGTGTGLLSLMLAQKATGIYIDAVEIDPAAAKQAGENIAASPWAQRISIHTADINNFSSTGKYDFITSNPPFYQNELKGPDAKKNTAHHDESLLLADLVSVIKKWLKPDGRFFLLLPVKRIADLRSLLVKENLATVHCVLVKQSVNHDYFRVLIEGGFDLHYSAEEKTTELTIKDKNDQYMPAFVELLRDYYLKLPADQSPNLPSA